MYCDGVYIYIYIYFFFKLSVKSFIDIVNYLSPYILRLKCFISERISQDPLEKLFGCQRQRGGFNENPTVRVLQIHPSTSSDKLCLL